MKQQDKSNDFLQDLVKSAMAQIKQISDSNLVMGTPILSPAGSTIIPISKISVGYVVGGGEFAPIKKNQTYPNAGGSSGGVSINPVGFIVENGADFKFVDITNKTSYEALLNIVSTIVNKIDKKMENNNEKDK